MGVTSVPATRQGAEAVVQPFWSLEPSLLHPMVGLVAVVEPVETAALPFQT